VIAAIPVTPCEHMYGMGRMTRSAVRRYSATAGCPLAAVGISTKSPGLAKARAARNRTTVSRPLNQTHWWHFELDVGLQQLGECCHVRVFEAAQ